MSEIEQDVAVLKDWREDHQKEHDKMDGKLSDFNNRVIDFTKAIERLDTKMALVVGIGTVIGSVIGSVAPSLIGMLIR